MGFLNFNITNLDRFTMGSSLAVHIIFAVIGIALPLVICIAEYLGTKNNDAYYKLLSKRLTLALLLAGLGYIFYINHKNRDQGADPTESY